MNVQEEEILNAYHCLPTRIAGKTTITEQLLYFGEEEAGTVKGKKTETLLNLTGWILKQH